MQQHIFFSCTKEELLSMMMDCVEKALSAHFSQTPINNPSTNESVTAALLTIKDMCELFGVSKVTIHNWMKGGKLPYKKKGRRVYFIEHEVMNSFIAPYISKRRQR